MSNLDKEKREALKKFRGQENNDDYDSDRMFTHHHDGTYGVHNHFGVVSFYIMTYEERKELLVKRIADLQRMVDEDRLELIHDDMRTYLLQCGGANFDHGMVDGFQIFYSGEHSGWCDQTSWDWEAMQKTFQAQQEQEAS